MENIRILAIAPYEGMRLALLEAAAKRQGLSLNVSVGDLEKGMQIVKDISPDHYDVIISRGGTAEMIRTATHLPVVEIPLSVYDILRSIRLVQSFSEQHAIVGFPSITNVAHLLRDLLNTQIEIMTIHSSEQVLQILEGLKEKGYKMIIGDMITSSVAKKVGMNSVLLTSGSESIDNAFDMALQQYKLAKELKRQNRLLKNLLASSARQILLFDPRQSVVLNTLLDDSDFLVPVCKKELASANGKGSYSFLKKNKDKSRQYQIQVKPFGFEDGAQYTAFAIEFADGHTGLSYINTEKAQAEYQQSFYTIGLSSDAIQRQTERYQHAGLPLVITGERGTGRDCLAAMLYLQSACTQHPMIVVDCETATEKCWKYLLDSHLSPLCETGRMLFFRNCQFLTPALSQQLFDFVTSAGASVRNRLLFVFTLIQGQELHTRLYRNLLEHEACLKISLPSLRDSMSEIQNLISLCISAQNVILGKQIISMEEGAFPLIRAFEWPENFAQLKRVIGQAMLLARENLIQECHVREVLAQEIASSQSIKGSAKHQFPPEMNLAQITRHIALAILEEEGHNQSQAAKRLGISRSTLWRMLKE